MKHLTIEERIGVIDIRNILEQAVLHTRIITPNCVEQIIIFD